MQEIEFEGAILVCEDEPVTKTGIDPGEMFTWLSENTGRHLLTCRNVTMHEWEGEEYPSIIFPEELAYPPSASCAYRVVGMKAGRDYLSMRAINLGDEG